MQEKSEQLGQDECTQDITRWWACGNDDRSVVGCGYTADDALDAYLALLADARNLAA
jgi:hypothetical protein